VYPVTLLLQAVALTLLLALFGGMWRAVIGPTAADRLVAVQVLGTLGIGILLLLARLLDQPAARDAALLMALLSLVVTLTFLRRLPPGPPPKMPPGADDA
jgi:multicomponent Na+:H+ antiporter subunit F